MGVLMQERDWLCFRVIAAVHPPIVHSGHLIPGQFEMVSRILSIRGHNVILDMDLARMYGTTTKALN